MSQPSKHKSFLQANLTGKPDKFLEVYSKVCNCKGTSSTNQVRISTETVDGVCKMTAAFYAQPSCDECGKPWEKEAAE